MSRATSGLELGAVFNRALKTISVGIGPFACIALLWAGLPHLLSVWLIHSVAGSALETAVSLTTSLALAPAYAVGQAAIIHGSLGHFAGESIRFGASMRCGARLFLPAAAISYVVGLGVTLGALLLIVPGVLLGVRWAVTMPVRVAEGPGIRAAFKRSVALTRGRRWSIFMLFAMLIAVGVLVLFLVAGTLGLRNDIWRFGLSPLWVSVSTIINGALIAALYWELRSHPHGAASTATAAVFD